MHLLLTNKVLSCFWGRCEHSILLEVLIFQCQTIKHVFVGGISHAADCFKRMWDIVTVNLSRHTYPGELMVIGVGNFIGLYILVIGGKDYMTP